MRDIRSVRDNFHGLEQIQGLFVFSCPIHDVSHLKFNRCLRFHTDGKMWLDRQPAVPTDKCKNDTASSILLSMQ